MHAGLSRTAASLVFGGWHWETGVAVPLIVASAMYVIGARAWRSRSAREVTPRSKVAAFIGGSIALAFALLSSLDAAANDLFTAHMIQHELLIAVAAPLLVMAEPGVALLWALPARARRNVGSAIAAAPVRRFWRRATRPVDAFLVHALGIWIWHVPVLFQGALTNDAVHLAQHITFFGSGLLYWWSVLHPRRRDMLGLSIISLFGTAVHTAALGALLATSRLVWYPAYGARAAEWGLSALQDQQIAGLVMWIPAGFVYLAAALPVFARWMRPSRHPEERSNDGRLRGGGEQALAMESR